MLLISERFEFPEKFETLAVPADNGLRLYNDKRFAARTPNSGATEISGLPTSWQQKSAGVSCCITARKCAFSQVRLIELLVAGLA